MLAEQLLKAPGFLYEAGRTYYYLGKWICKECTETDAADCVVMYNMCRNGHEEAETSLYFQKLRAYSDFALEVPCNPGKVKEDISAFLDGLSEEELRSLEVQFSHFEEDLKKYCG